MMLFRVLVCGLVFWPCMSFAQQGDSAALGQEIMFCVGEKVNLRARVISLEAELNKLRNEMAAAAAPKPEKKE